MGGDWSPRAGPQPLVELLAVQISRPAREVHPFNVLLLQMSTNCFLSLAAVAVVVHECIDGRGSHLAFGVLSHHVQNRPVGQRSVDKLSIGTAGSELGAVVEPQLTVDDTFFEKDRSEVSGSNSFVAHRKRRSGSIALSRRDSPKNGPHDLQVRWPDPSAGQASTPR